MWLWISILILTQAEAKQKIAAPVDLGRIQHDSLGVKSTEEAETLWREGQKSFREGNFLESARLIQRFIARYPSDPNFTEAHFLLGQSLQAMGEHHEALAPLRFYAEAFPVSEAGWNAKLKLAESYIGMKKYHQASALGAEVFKRTSVQGHATNAEFSVHGLLTQSLAQAHLNHRVKSQALLDSAVERIKIYYSEENLPPAVAGHIQSTRTAVGILQCQEFKIRRRALDEGQTREFLRRHALCLVNAGTELKKTLEAKELYWINQATQNYTQAIQNFREECTQLPQPPGHRKPKQAQQFFNEIKEIQRKDCTQHLADIRGIFKSQSKQLEPLLKVLERALPE